MSELFNWGGETPEQRQARLQWEQELLIEQARMKAMAMQAGAVGGSGGCNPAKGIGMYLTFDFGEDNPFGLLKSLARMEYQGVDEGGKPTYEFSFEPGKVAASLNYDYGLSKWKFTFTTDGSIDYYSEALIGSNWTTDTPGSPIVRVLSECGYPELPVYCMDVSEIPPTGDLGLVEPIPTWLEDQSVTEAPILWNGVSAFFVWLPVLGGPDGWFLSAGEEEGGVLGGSVNELPLGEIPLSGGSSVTVSEGACEF